MQQLPRRGGETGFLYDSISEMVYEGRSDLCVELDVGKLKDSFPELDFQLRVVQLIFQVLSYQLLQHEGVEPPQRREQDVRKRHAELADCPPSPRPRRCCLLRKAA